MEYPQDGGGGEGGGPLHWGYSGWAPPAPRRPSKRAPSESDDNDDLFSEESGKDQCTSPGDTDSCQMLSRKKRRGVIEKKRRDRINTSLTELKRLVPSALEKQGSAKLEKAEILQLTVDHLKMLHAKGVDTFAYDPQRYAMDYHSIGFRECASEVARYLVSCEGLDIQDPLRLRLMSHLQCFAAQRELATKSCAAPYPSAYPGYAQVAAGGAQPYPHAHAPLSAAPNTHHEHHQYTEASASSAPPTAPPTSSSSYVTAGSGTYAPPPSGTSYAPPPYHQPPPPHHQYSQGSSKPYRPWGAELAY